MNRKDDRDKAQKIPTSPKRGAIPSPRSDIDSAKPYVPDEDDDEDAGGSPGNPGSAPARGPSRRGEHKKGG